MAENEASSNQSALEEPRDLMLYNREVDHNTRYIRVNTKYRRYVPIVLGKINNISIGYVTAINRMFYNYIPLC